MGIIIVRARRSGRYQNFNHFVAEAAEVFRGDLNTSVTNIEYELNDSDTIVSTTELQGNITYANPYFILVSGYSQAELIGAPQNILRHPDMPAEAFADFWRTIKNGRPWTGMVKNRPGNGDFY